MAHSAQASKRARQSEKRRVANKSVHNEIKTLTKTLRERIDSKDVEGAQKLLRTLSSKIDKAAKRHQFHRNSAARRKSQVANLVGGLEKAGGAKA